MNNSNIELPRYEESFDPKNKRKKRFKCYNEFTVLTDYSELNKSQGKLVGILLRENSEPVTAFVEKVLVNGSKAFQKVYLQYESPFEGNVISEYILPRSGKINRRNFSLSPKKTFHWDANKRRFSINEKDLSSRDTKYL